MSGSVDRPRDDVASEGDALDSDDPAVVGLDLDGLGIEASFFPCPEDGDDGSDADGTSSPEGLPDGLLSDDWSSPASGTAATWRDIPIAFVEAHKPTLPSSTFVARDLTAVAYTRESSEDQTENSQPRQIANIKAYEKSAGLHVKEYYSDLGVSGTSLHNRLRFQAMMEAARRREFKVVVVEHLDRFGRSLPIVLDAWEELRDLGIELHDAKTGKLDLAHIVIMGYLGVEGRVRFLDLCKGGKRNAVAKGLVMHAPSYGYRKHPSRRGVHLVVADRAEVVRLIFRWVSAGVGTKRIADELTARGTLSPRQCQRRDNGETPDERSLSWDAIEIRNIVRNPIYAGWNIWGRTTPRRDRGTKRILGHDVRPREDWVVSRVPSLAIVSEEVQAGAMASMRRRSFGGASSANRAGTRLLAGCMTCASCGWPMHAGVTNERHHVYYCSDHRSSRLDRCQVASTVRLDWVERLVVAHVAARVGDLADEAAYRGRFQAAFDEGDAERRRRVAEIDRASARIRDDLKASYIAMTRRTGVPEDVIAEVNAGLQARIDQLAAVRAGLVAVPTPAMAFEGLDTLAGGLASMAASIPFRPADPEGEALAQRFRRLVGRILVHPREKGVVRLELRPDRDRVTGPKGFQGRGRRRRPCPPRRRRRRAQARGGGPLRDGLRRHAGRGSGRRPQAHRRGVAHRRTAGARSRPRLRRRSLRRPDAPRGHPARAQDEGCAVARSGALRRRRHVPQGAQAARLRQRLG